MKQIHSTGNINVVKAELAVSVMLSSLVRRGICPNFVAIRGMFSSEYEPPDNYWGTADNKRPKGPAYDASKIRRKAYLWCCLIPVFALVTLVEAVFRSSVALSPPES